MTEWQLEPPDRRKLISIDEIVEIKSRPPVSTTRSRGWNGLTVDLYAARTHCYAKYPALDHHLICYCPSGSARLIQRRDGVVHEGLICAGVSLLMPAGCESVWDGDAAASARLRMPTSIIASAAEQIGRRSTSQYEIRNVFETRDTVIERVAQILLAELERQPHPT